MKTTYAFARAIIVAFSIFAAESAAPAFAQDASLTGKVTRDNGELMGGAIVTIEELRRETRTGPDGTYRFEAVPPGRYHVSVRAEGYTTPRTEVSVTAPLATLDLVVALDLHFQEVVSVSPTARPQFESYQPTTVLAGQELQKQIDSTLGATLKDEPGLAMRSLGSGPARPVIRGLDGDRIAIMTDGQRTGDLSSQSADHGVTVNPASAERIEVVRGPATLLYGANAIGGLVNVLTQQIPTAGVNGATGNFTFDAGSNAREAAGGGELRLGNGAFAVAIGANGRHTGNFRTADEEIDNSKLRQSGFNVGVSRTMDRNYVGASYVFDDSKYGIPFVEEGETQLTPQRHAVTVRAGGSGLNRSITSYRATLGIKRYNHDELDGETVATHFDNDTEEGELLLSHRQFGKLSGTFGGSFLTRRFNTEGEEVLSPPIDQNSGALFAYEEFVWPHATVQFGARADHTRFTNEAGLPDRTFNEWSGSVGVLLRPQAANDKVAVAINLARAARNPALEELYYFGVHPGNFAFEIGNPDIGAEHALGFDVALRGRFERFNGEITYFRNDIANFIFRNPLSDEEVQQRTPEFNDRFGTSGPIDAEEFPVIEYGAADSVLQGVEAHFDAGLTDSIAFEFGYDMVRGSLKDSGEPLPRIPPFRVIAGLTYRKNAIQLGGNVTHAADQNRVFGEELPTEGYTLLKLFGAYSFTSGRVTNTITARLDNAANELYFNHLNYLKDVLPEMGRNFKLIYSVGF
jgi:iron complex outermembrane recepter protein